MGDSASIAVSAPAQAAEPPRHSATVRLTHWITAACCLALLVSGVELIVSHPRFYWGETGNVNEAPLFSFPIPSSRATVPTGYGYVLPDQNGWSRYLHFQSAWLLVLSGLVYIVVAIWTRHLRRNLWPARADVTWRALTAAMAKSLRRATREETEAVTYNGLQRITYLAVVFALVPLLVWTGLAMSDTFTAGWPAAASLLGGRQSARTLHFCATLLLVAFAIVHVAMVYRAGFVRRVGDMITGGETSREGR